MIKMNEEELKKEKEWYEKAIIDLTKFGIHNNGLNPVEEVHLVDYKKMYLYLKQIEKLQNNRNELKKFVEEEKNRLATQVSNTYKDSLDKIHFVNEDIFNELTKVSEKMQEMEQGKDE